MSRIIDTRQLRAFVSLAQTGSFTVTAKDISLTQSAISHSIRTLEEEVGCRLFDRMSKTVSLTLAGEHLLRHAEKIILEMTAARDELDHLAKWGRSRLRLGASAAACQHILPRVMRDFQAAFPQCVISIDPGDFAPAMDALRAHRTDLAIVLGPQVPESFEFHPLFTDELRYIVSPDHPWAAAGRVVTEEIVRQNYILYDRASVTSRLIEDYFHEEGIVLNTFMDLGDMQAIKELVKLGLGISIVAPWVVREEIARGSLVALPLGRRKLRRVWGVSYWKTRRLSLAEETFIRLCREKAAGLGEGVTPAAPAAAKTAPADG